jgi:tRNA (mo5U34)-methyltransferase
VAFEGLIQDFPEFQKSRDDLLARAKELGWYHSLQLDASFRTRGEFDLEPYVPYYLPFSDLSAFRCFEVGSGNGFWAFEMEKRGAAAVTTLDLPDFFDTDFSIRFGRDNERPQQRAAAGAFGEAFRVAAVLRQSKVRYQLGNVYDVRPETYGRFGLVFCGSMLMHLFGPLLALQRMAAICDDALLITTQTDLSLEPSLGPSYHGHEIPFVHFVPSPTCLQAMLTSCGYEKVVRGPTFFLEFRDRANPMKIPHTLFIGLKRLAGTALGLPKAALVLTSDAQAKVELVSDIRHVAAGEPFDLLVRVRNTSGNAWYSPDPLEPIVLTAEADGGRAPSRVPVGDFLPAGLDTLVSVQCVAPLAQGNMTLSFSISQGALRFHGPAPSVTIAVRDSTLRDSISEGVRGVVSRLRHRF